MPSDAVIFVGPELWKAIPSFEGKYEASTAGRIRRIGSGHGVVCGRILKQGEHACGYLTVSLHKENRGHMFLVHRLIALAFIGPWADAMEVNHKDGDKRSNRPDNLEYVCRQANIDHAVATGLIQNKGEKNMQAVLTEEQVVSIRDNYTEGGYRNGGRGYKSLAKEFGVDWGTIRNIVKRRIWKHVA